MKAFAVVVVAAASLLLQERWVPDEAWLRSRHPRNHPKEGFVTKKETALAIGRAIILERFGDKFLKSEEPLDAKMIKNTWVVYGFLPSYMVGGTVNVLLSPSTGAVLNVFVEQ